MSTPQTQAIGVANAIILAAQALLTLSQTIQAASLAWTDDAVANELNALQTCALSTDGSLGAVDGSPNVSHPINTAQYPTLVRALSANQIAAMLTIINAIPTYVGGGAVPAAAWGWGFKLSTQRILLSPITRHTINYRVGNLPTQMAAVLI